MSEPRVTTEQKQSVSERAHDCCEYCGSQLRFSPDPFSVEHIKPKSLGGSDNMNNLALSCQGCNNRKYTSVRALDPVTGRMAPLFNPRRHSWNEHFTWGDGFTHMIGQSPTGRATVAKLQLNREGVTNLRRLLRTVGKHPPSGHAEPP